MRALKAHEAEQALKQLNASLRHPWTIQEGRLTKTFEFRDFVQAFGFMTQVALLAEKHDHHPEWCNVYRRVTIALYTHEARGLTQKDFDLARAIEALAGIGKA